MEKTWTAWVLSSSEEAFLLDHVAGAGERMPVMVLDEGAARAESLLASCGGDVAEAARRAQQALALENGRGA